MNDNDELEKPGRIDFRRINRVAITHAVAVARGLLPDGRKEGCEWVARNPLRHDKHLGSFKVNLSNGKWADFATGDSGGDLISLAAFIAGLPQSDAAIRLAETLRVDGNHRMRKVRVGDLQRRFYAVRGAILEYEEEGRAAGSI